VHLVDEASSLWHWLLRSPRVTLVACQVDMPCPLQHRLGNSFGGPLAQVRPNGLVQADFHPAVRVLYIEGDVVGGDFLLDFFATVLGAKRGLHR
jgi:hypothetical protein